MCRQARSRFAFTVSALALILAAATPAQTPDRTAAEQKRGSKQPPPHHPRPELPPTRVLHHLRQGNAAVVAARAARKPLPKPEPRPSGAGRYLCAVFACPDADIDVPALLGLRRADVLVLSTPGPFVSHESVARLEHYVSKQRLPLIVVLTHDNCATTATGSGKTPLQKALAERLALARRRAEQRGHSLPRTLARTQCEMLFAASPTLQRAIQDNRLRTLPASVDPKTLAVTWHTKSTEEMPIPVVK